MANLAKLSMQILPVAGLGILLSWATIYLGARWKKINCPGKAFVAAIACTLTQWLLIGACLSIKLPLLPAALGAAAGLLLGLPVIRRIYDVDMKRAIAIWVFNLLGQLLAIIIRVLIL